MEEESRNAFQTGKVSLLRNWPYVYSLAKQAQVHVRRRAAARLAGGKPASVLGGYNLGISTYSKNPGAALSFINFATGPAAQKKFFIKSSLPAVLTQTYTDPAVIKSQPFAPQLLKAVQNGDAAAGVAGVSADQRGDLQERLLGAVERHGAADRAEERAEPDQLGPEDVLGQHRGDDCRGNDRRPASAPSLGSLRAAARRGDGVAVADRDRDRGGVSDRLRDLAVAAPVQRHPPRPVALGRLGQLHATR